MDELLYNADGSFNLSRLCSALKEALVNVTLGLEGDADLPDTVVEQMQQYESILAGLPQFLAPTYMRLAVADTLRRINMHTSVRA